MAYNCTPPIVKAWPIKIMLLIATFTNGMVTIPAPGWGSTRPANGQMYPRTK